ncbi:MAG: IS21 family transposase, partial [Acidobacteria bacterium]|nr:IS21 family transposase [Acidobacteriota bacterium]
MPQERLSMRKIKEVLRLHSLGLTQRQIARSCSVGQSTVSEYVKAAKAAQLSWPEVSDWDEARLAAALLPKAPPAPQPSRPPEPDFAAIHTELQQHKHLTLLLVWQEYRAQHPDGYRYSRFCELYQRWRRKLEVVLRQEHRAGEKLFVDYAGRTVPVQDPASGAIRQAQLFVAVLGASNYTFAEATWTQGLADWIGSHLRAFEFLDGAPEIVVPDNLKSGVTKACRYEPGVNLTYEEMAQHYGVAVVPARVRKPRDKAKVEAGVLLVERWILAALRKRTFFSLGALNEAIAELLARLNERPFRKREGSRRTLYEALDRPALKPLPAERYQYGEWKTARVNIDHHVEFDHHWYSVPYQLTQKEVEIRASPATVEIFHQGVRVAAHARSWVPHHHTTLAAHRPKSHQRHLEWTPSRIVEWSATIGPATAQVVERILASNRHPEQGYRSCLGVIRLGDKYPHLRVEAAARRAVAL